MLLQQQPVLEANLTKNQQTIELLSKIMQIKKLKEAATQLTLCEAFFTVAVSDKPWRSHATHDVLTQWKILHGAKGKPTQQVTLSMKQTKNSNNKYRFVSL